jgi:hypothetical protein
VCEVVDGECTYTYSILFIPLIIVQNTHFVGTLSIYIYTLNTISYRSIPLQDSISFHCGLISSILMTQS